MFVLRHDVSAPSLHQNQWRFCSKCNVMFFDGFPSKGRCAAGDGHQAAGFDFALRFVGNLEDDVELVPVDE